MKKLAVAVAVALSVLFVAASAPDALARKKVKGESLTARVGKKKFKANLKPSIVGSYQTLTGAFTLNGLYTKIRLGGGSVKNLLISGAAPDLAGATLPLTVTNCPGTYSDNTYKGLVPPSTPNAWGTGNGMTVVFEKFDPATGRAEGTFSGTMPAGASTPGLPDAVFTKGKFRVDLLVQ